MTVCSGEYRQQLSVDEVEYCLAPFEPVLCLGVLAVGFEEREAHVENEVEAAEDAANDADRAAIADLLLSHQCQLSPTIPQIDPLNLRFGSILRMSDL